MPMTVNTISFSPEEQEKLQSLTRVVLPLEVPITRDLSDYTDIRRGMVVELDDEHYLIVGNMYESRFTLEEYPKYWVKSAIELKTGMKKILKWEFNENFVFPLGLLKIKCYRSAQKEADILDLVQGNSYFMQGKTVKDSLGTEVKIIDFIYGNSFYNYIHNLKLDHHNYFQQLFPDILKHLVHLLTAIAYIHNNDYVHGDIRNDHIFIDDKNGNFKWIDFDTKQDFDDFDIWSLGNILLFAAGKGVHTFKSVKTNPDVSAKGAASICKDDSSAFFKHRIMNLQKLFPYIPDKLNRILMHFSINTTEFYECVMDIILDVEELLEEMGK
ncbi:MAG: hypothetical protein HQK83_15560 [Fibrobacteria bacterium]|nr:hypothetical protein [Fibrobacteria bacterium]